MDATTITVNKCCLKPTELTSEQIDIIDPILKPGTFSSEGFMSANDNLLDIYHTDMQTLADKQITIKQIVDVLTSIVEKYKRKNDLVQDANIYNGNFSPEIKEYHEKELLQLDKSLFSMKCNLGYSWKNNSMVKHTNPIIIDKKYLVTRISYWGFQPCPFICFSTLLSRTECGGGDDYWIYDLETKKTLQFNDLVIHLIGDHHFFEGNVYNRLDPNTVIDFFNLQPGIDYTNKFLEEERWIRRNEGGDISPCFIFGPTNEINISHVDKNTIAIECTQRDYSQQDISYKHIHGDPNKLIEMINTIKHEYVYCEILVDQLSVRHRLDLKKVSIYDKKIIKYIPINEEGLFPKKIYGSDITYTSVPKAWYLDHNMVNGKCKTNYVRIDPVWW